MRFCMRRSKQMKKHRKLSAQQNTKPPILYLGREIEDFFSQETDDEIPESTRGSTYLNPSSTQKVNDYFKNQVTSMIKTFTDTQEEGKDHHDILGVTSKEGLNQPEYMAASILSALTLMQSRNAPPTLNFPTNVRFFNLIVYFKDVPDELDANISLPQTAIPIIGEIYVTFPNPNCWGMPNSRGGTG